MGKRYCSEINVVINQRCGHTMTRAARGGGEYLSHVFSILSYKQMKTKIILIECGHM